uniref:Gypsy retrotransposon integrase-like protein 1 n=1 Tax=Salmo trutta TaxID=8032 RepID=A0A674EBM2_SALTR
MDFSGVPSPRMDWESTNLPDAWRKYKQHVELMFTGPLKERGEEEKCSYLLLWIGEKGRDIYNTWTLTEAESKALKTYYDRFEAYVVPKTNTIFARYKFHEKVQGASESFEPFVTELRLLVKDCDYANKDEMVRDRIVFGIHSPRVREKLLNVGSELTLDKAIDIARSHELAQAQMKTISRRSTSTSREQAVHAVRQTSKHTSGAQRARFRTERDITPKQSDTDSKRPKTCGYCGYKVHGEQGNYPAKGKQCTKCGKWNHFAKVCRAYRGKTVHTVSEDEMSIKESNDDELFIDSVTQKSHISETEQAFADIEIGTQGTKLKFKLDTGAQVNIIPLNKYRSLTSECELQPTMRRLTGYGGEQLPVKGTCTFKCKYKESDMMLDFYVVDTRAPAVLGLKACLDMDLIKLVLSVTAPVETGNVLEEFADVFTGIGLFPGECTIHLDPDATPVVYPPRKIPLALRARLKKELESMEQSDIVTKVTEPTDWVNALVVVEKPRTGKLRVCLDPRDLNKAIKRPHYPLPTLDGITHKLAGAHYFSVMDARSGYWAIKLTEESSKLTTFNTPFGRYRFRRLPFGIISAQDEFQRKIDEVYEGLDGVVAIVDDILVYGRTKEEHDRNLRAMLQRSRERGVRLNPEKSTVGATEVSYFGHLLTANGIKPDPQKISAIKEMEPPKNRAELETVLGMVNYLSKFAPSLSNANAPLRQLLKQSSEFLWDKQHDIAFQNVKDLITREPGPILAYYDPNKELRLQVDASKYGLGAVLLQEGKPIGYASKSLTDCEINYAQIEKELYAILFGCKRFHQYVYGRQVIVESDHKPLESIMRKPLAAAPPRLQRMILQLQKYDFTITHRPGKDIPVADTLSRMFLTYKDSSLSEGMDMQVYTVYSNLPVSDTKLKEIQAETGKDSQLTQLREVKQDGWPEERRKCPQSVSEFWNHRDELSQINGIIFKGEKIIIPTSLREEILTKIHAGHMGMEKCKQRARDIMFWPGMCKQIEDIVGRCTICLERRPSNTKEPMLPHCIPDRPWQVVATDLFTWNNEDYIVTVDYYSRYFELDKLHSTTSAAVIHKLKAAFARHGIVETLISDNGPCYKSNEFESFTKAWEFTHVTTSPHYPQSNGLAEKSVQIAKSLMDKAKADKRDPYLSLLEYRNTPVDNFKSPAQLLMSRRLRSTLPSTNQQLQPEVVSYNEMHGKRAQRQQQQKRYYDRSARPLPPLIDGESVRIQEHGLWKPAVVIQPADTERSYYVRTAEGAVYRRNRRHLLNTKEQHTDEMNCSPERERDGLNTHTAQHTPYLPATPQELLTDTEACSTSYRTRSGREVKPRAVLDL